MGERIKDTVYGTVYIGVVLQSGATKLNIVNNLKKYNLASVT